MRFLADMGVDIRVVDWLRSLHRAADADIFTKAGAESRVILTFDLDFGEILALSGGATISVILFRLRNTRAPYLMQRLASVLSAEADALTAGAVIVIEDGRHRVRELPITGPKPTP